MVDDLDSRFNKLKETTKLPEDPDYEAINNLLISILYNVVKER